MSYSYELVSELLKLPLENLKVSLITILSDTRQSLKHACENVDAKFRGD